MSGVLCMKNFTRKVVILENLTSPYIHQAIIVLNDYNPANETKVINDAEKIVSQYLIKNGYMDRDNTKTYVSKEHNKQKNKSHVKSVLAVLLGMAVFLTAIIKLF